MNGDRMNGPLLGCIADDFTGATDLANNLVRSGMRTVQMIGVPEAGQAEEGGADAIVVALKSRSIAAADAVAQSLDALRWLQRQGAQQIYFKYCSTFDSTPEGNIGPVTDALLGALSSLPDGDFTIACPAFPENQRTIFNGHLFVGEQLLSDSSMRDHPLTPMTDASLVRVLQRQSRHKVGLIAHGVVARGPEAIRERVAVLRDEGVRIAVVDAITNADLMRIGAALQGWPLITAGSGVAIGLAQNWPQLTRPAEAVRADRLPPPSGRCAIVSGSCSVATNAQVLRFKKSGRPSFAIDPLAIAAGQDLVREVLAWAGQCRSDGPLLVYATADPTVIKDVQAQLGTARAGEIVEQALSKIARGLVESGVRQLIVAGGETSGAVVRELGVRQMRIGTQIDPGVPWTAAQSPACPGETLHLALKSGNFGSDGFFAEAFDRLAAA